MTIFASSAAYAGQHCNTYAACTDPDVEARKCTYHTVCRYVADPPVNPYPNSAPPGYGGGTYNPRTALTPEQLKKKRDICEATATRDRSACEAGARMYFNNRVMACSRKKISAGVDLSILGRVGPDWDVGDPACETQHTAERDTMLAKCTADYDQDNLNCIKNINFQGGMFK